MSTTLTGEPQPMANGKASRVGDALAPPIPDWRHPQAVFDYKDARGNLLYQPSGHGGGGARPVFKG